jgi:hypothetical protein
MTVTALNPRTTDQRATAVLRLAPPSRLSLATAGSVQGRLDGAWWPRSRDLAVELRSLTAELDVRWGRITRVTVNPAYWPEIPRKVQVGGHVMHVGWFAEGHGTADVPFDVTAGVTGEATAGVPASTAADGTAAGTRI